MEKKIVVSKRFRKNSLEVFEFLTKEYSQKTAFNFLDKLEQGVEFIIRYTGTGMTNTQILATKLTSTEVRWVIRIVK